MYCHQFVTKFPPIKRFHNIMSLGWIVTRPAWIEQMFTSSNILTRNDSDTSWRARSAVLWNRRPGHIRCETSLTSLWKESFRIKRSVDFWYFLISRRATVPGRKRRGFLTPPVSGSPIFIPFFVLYLPRGALPPVLLLAVCLVRPMITTRDPFEIFWWFSCLGKPNCDGMVQKQRLTT